MAALSIAHVLGVDAARRGWVGMELADGRFSAAHAAPTLAELLDDFDQFDAVGIDIPMGCTGGRRACDGAARAYIRPFGSSVFSTPVRGAREQPTYEGANAWCAAQRLPKLSRQSWALVPKMNEAEALWIAQPDRVFEVHPEVSFRAMAGPDGALAGRKKSWSGHTHRRELLAAVGIEIPAHLGGDADRAAPDDVLDAAAAAWSAHRIATGVANCLPGGEDEHDVDHPDRLVAIWI